MEESKIKLKFFERDFLLFFPMIVMLPQNVFSLNLKTGYEIKADPCTLLDFSPICSSVSTNSISCIGFSGENTDLCTSLYYRFLVCTSNYFVSTYLFVIQI